MKLKRSLVEAARLLLISSCNAQANTTSSAAASTPTIDLGNCCNTTTDATAFALVYGSPLIQLINQTNQVFAAVGGANRINHQTGLASLSSAAVVKPNVDTLYSRVVVDLSQSDLILTVPNITDRYWIYPFYDAYGNNFAELSIVKNSSPGQYLLRRSDDAGVAPGLQLTPSTPECLSTYQGVVNFPTTYGTMLIRLLLKQNTTENLDIVHQYQNETSLVTTPRQFSQSGSLLPPAPPISSALVNGSLIGSSVQQRLELLARFAPYNQPEILADRYRVASILGLAGIVGGNYNKPADVNLTQAYAIANATINDFVTDPSNIYYAGNGWQLAPSYLEGDFSTYYAERAYIASTGYQQLQSYEVIYPGYEGASFSSYTLAANQSFLFTFSGRPPIMSIGFWSLTIYGADQYLIPNPVNRFEVGDRSNLTYQDGTLVYGAGAANVTDEPFEVLMQPADLVPPSNWTSNWLPAPAGGGGLSFILRFYTPEPALTNGSYVYPQVQRISAIV